MPTFDYVQIGSGPVTLTCRGCGRRITADPRDAQQTVDRHKCGRTTKNSAR